MAILLTSVGIASHRLVRWRLRDRGPVETGFAPVATARLVGGVERAIVLTTAQAAANSSALRAELDLVGVAARAEPIPTGGNEAELWEIFAAVGRVLGHEREVILDVTHSFRHLPFVLFATLGYLTSLRGLAVRGVYYGALEAGRDDEAPLLDLRPLLDLAEWSHATRAFRESGSTRWLGVVARAERKRIAALRGAVPAGEARALEALLSRLGRLEGTLDRLGWTLGAGLPIESSIDAASAISAVETMEAGDSDARGDQSRTIAAAASPVMASVLPALREALEPIAIPAPKGGGREVKAGLPLDSNVTTRDLRLARSYHRWQAYDRALLILREWVIDRCLLASGEASRWLDYGASRLPMERALNAAAARREYREPDSPADVGERDTPRFQSLSDLWQAVKVRRNPVAHAGKRAEWVNPDAEAVRRLLEVCEARAHDDAFWSVERPGASGRLLVTALGRSPGVLFTALVRLEPDAVAVIASGETADWAHEAWARASEATRGARCARPIVLDPLVADPYRCFVEVERVLAWARPHVLAAAHVVANITGGTSAMQYLVERVAGHSERLGVPVKRCALVDRRPPDVQLQKPWVAGEVVDLAGDDERVET